MNCEDLRKCLPLYVDNELSAEETRDLRHHLDACPECCRVADSEERFQTLLREHLAEVPAPPGLRERICLCLADEASAREIRPRRASRLPAWGAVAALLLLAGGFVAGRLLAPGGHPDHIVLRGHLVCLACDRAGVPLEVQRRCRETGHSTGLRTEEGRLVAFAPSQVVSALVSDPALRGGRVEAEGAFYPRIATLDPIRVRRL
jgi:anti-sigma factor (TIGR02949 family)